MTLKSRNVFIVVIFAVMSLGLVSYAVLLFRLDLAAPAFGDAVAQGQARYLDMAGQLDRQVLPINVVSPGISLLTAWLAALVFIRYFRKINSPQLFFLVLFWMSMGTEFVRVLNMVLMQGDYPLTVQLTLSRFQIMGRLVGSFLLFSASLYSAGLKIRLQELMLVVSVVLAAAISYLVPLNAEHLGQELLFMPSRGYSLDALRIFVGGLTLANFVKYAISTRDAREYLLLVPIFALVVGQELLFLATNWLVLITAWVLLALGSVWLTRRFIANYLWY